jgi:hypothetical protein
VLSHDTLVMGGFFKKQKNRNSSFTNVSSADTLLNGAHTNVLSHDTLVMGGFLKNKKKIEIPHLLTCRMITRY